MNLTKFLNQTDELTAQYSEKQLISFIHEIARILPEQHREDFISRLKSAGSKMKKADTSDYDFHEKYKLIQNNLKIIDSQEVSVSGTLNEIYDDWYDDDSEEFYYKDDEGISDMIAEACDFVHICMDTEKYKNGFEIGNQLLSMKILCCNEYGDEDLSLRDMVNHDLLHYDLKQVILDTAYCAYHAVSLKKRPEALYEVIINAGDREIGLETLMQHGEYELPEFQDFLTLWIEYLSDKKGRDAERLISEAVSLLNNASLAIKYAEKYAAVHPGLYLDILENEQYTAANINHMTATGLRAIQVIPKNYIMRSRVALKTAEYIIEADEKKDLLEKCYFAAYESDTSALNYMRALLNGYEYKEKKEKLQKVLMTFPLPQNNYSYSTFERNRFRSELEENHPDRTMLLMLRFLDGQLSNVLKDGLNITKALGWSGTFMKQGIALYLLYYYEGPQPAKGIAEMASIVKKTMNFSAAEYQKGTYKINYSDENGLFYNLFLNWKSTVPTDPDLRTNVLKKITNLLEKRTQGIMDANRRNYYRECAAYIAALGEVMESLGNTGAKQRLMTSYKNKYSRRSAFRAEMRDFGWIDINRKPR